MKQLITDSRNPADWLQTLLYREATTCSAAELDHILSHGDDESVFHDFKGTRGLAKGKFKDDLRQDSAAFANCEGGLLIIGVEEERVPGGDRRRLSSTCDTLAYTTNPTDYLGALLKDQAPYHQPGMRFVKVEGPHDIPVSIVVVPRSSRWVWVRNTLYLRCNSHSCPLPGQVAADVVHGSKQRPHFQIREAVLGRDVERNSGYLKPGVPWPICLAVSVENDSEYFAEGVRLGLIAHSFGAVEETELGLSVSSHLAIQPPDAESRHKRLAVVRSQLHLHDGRPVPFDLPPFEQHRLKLSGLNFFGAPALAYEWAAALYVSTKNQGVSWFQLRVERLQVDAMEIPGKEGSQLPVDCSPAREDRCVVRLRELS